MIEPSLFIIAAASIALMQMTACNGDSSCKGCVDLDELTFDKVTEKFRVSIVKFDIAYPYGDQHTAFARLAAELAARSDILVGSVGIKDYGEKENERLASGLGISKDDLPTVRLFGKKSVKPGAKLSKETNWTVESLRSFVRDNSDVRLTLPGCLEEFDDLAAKFVTNRESRTDVIKGAEERLQLLQKPSHIEFGQVYVKLMKKIHQVGDDFVETEGNRLRKILEEGKISDHKKSEISNRLNVLRSFQIMKPKDEL